LFCTGGPKGKSGEKPTVSKKGGAGEKAAQERPTKKRFWMSQKGGAKIRGSEPGIGGGGKVRIILGGGRLPRKKQLPIKAENHVERCEGR